MKNSKGFWYSLPITIWMTLLFVIPSSFIVLISFLKKDLFRGFRWEFSLEAYKSLITPSFIKTTLNTIGISAVATIVTVAIAIPVALYIATSKYKTMFLFLIIVPFWTNFLIRVHAWITILGNNGLLNNLLINLREAVPFLAPLLDGAPYQLMYNKQSIILITVYCYLPYAILPLYSTIEKFDFSLIDAARDLGATKFYAYTRIFLPGIKTGIITAIIFTLIPSLGSYAVPQLVGDKNSYMLGNIIANELLSARNYPKASAIASLLMLIIAITIVAISKKGKKEGGNNE